MSPNPAPRKGARRVTFELEIRLEGVEPAIWRRFQVSGEATVEELHAILQLVMGWESSAGYDFEVDGRSFGGTMDDRSFGRIPRKKTRLRDLVSEEGDRFLYRYDLRADWRHRVRTVRKIEPSPRLRAPVCTGGARACPPEGTGGPRAYLSLLVPLCDPRHPGHDQAVRRAGARFDPEAFDAARVNERLLAIFGPKKKPRKEKPERAEDAASLADDLGFEPAPRRKM